MDIKKIGFIGLGLIGGSIAKTIRRIFPQIQLYATSGHLSTIRAAYQDHVICNKDLLDFSEFLNMDYIFLCTPVRQNLVYLTQLKDCIGKNTVITDVGSVKGDIHQMVTRLGLEANFIGGHPMAGSEKTGYAASTPYLLENAYYVITPAAQVSSEQAGRFRDFIQQLGATPLLMEPQHHDFATASISHLPHILAYALTNLVRGIDDENETMKTIAAGGFRDMTRIAASSPVMWKDICLSNKQQLLRLMDLYSSQLNDIRDAVQKEDAQYLIDYFSGAKNYRDSLIVRKPSDMQPVYELNCDIIDEVGGIATISALLAQNGISIKNIGILHNREFEDGVLHIELYDQLSLENAAGLLGKNHYTVYLRESGTQIP